jgi:hypothetical protein
MSSGNLPTPTRKRAPRKPPRLLPADIHQRLDWTIEQVMVITGEGRFTVIKKIHDGVYRARRLPNGAWALDKQGVLADRDRQYAQPPQLRLASSKPRGRPKDSDGEAA